MIFLIKVESNESVQGLESFVGLCPDGMECCHLDGDPENNNLNNLEWNTHSKNMKDRNRHGYKNQGHSKLTESDIHIIRNMTEKGIALQKIATMFDVAKSTISRIATRQRWKHV